MSINICGIGDIMLGENVHHYRRGIASQYRKRFNSLSSSAVRKFLNGTDLVVGNLECSLMPDEKLRRAPLQRAVYTAPESALHFFDDWTPPIVLNVANNHFGQHGEPSMAFTLGCLGRKRGIYVIGRESTPLELKLNRHRVRLLGVSLVQDECNGGYFKSTPERLIQDLEWGAKADETYRILSIHWGNEYCTMPTDVQQGLARMLTANGVDLILGHHPHVIQPVRTEGDAIVAYSHGNFIFDQNFSLLTRTGLMTISELTSRKGRCFKLHCHDHQIRSIIEIDRAALERFCRRHTNPSMPLIMRMLMKGEMIAHAYEVPKSVWRYFLLKMMNR